MIVVPHEKIEEVVLKSKWNSRTQALFVENELLELKVQMVCVMDSMLDSHSININFQEY